MTFSGESTAGGPFADLDAQPAAARNSIGANSLSVINSNGGSVIVTGNNGGPWDIEFTGPDNGNRDIDGLTEGIIISGSSNVRLRRLARGGLQTSLTFIAGVSPTAEQLQNHLLSLPASTR